MNNDVEFFMDKNYRDLLRYDPDDYWAAVHTDWPGLVTN
jgi:hypothetical protein